MPLVKGPDDSKDMVAFQSSAIVAKFRTETAHLFPYFFALFPLILPLCRYRLNLPTLSISILELYVIFVIFGGVIVLHQLQYSILQLWSKKKLLLILSSIFIAAGAIGIFFSVDPKFSLGVFRVYFVEHFIVAVIGWCLYDAGFFEKKHIRFGFVSGAILLVLVGTHALLQHAPEPAGFLPLPPAPATTPFPGHGWFRHRATDPSWRRTLKLCGRTVLTRLWAGSRSPLEPMRVSRRLDVGCPPGFLRRIRAAVGVADLMLDDVIERRIADDQILVDGNVAAVVGGEEFPVVKANVAWQSLSAQSPGSGWPAGRAVWRWQGCSLQLGASHQGPVPLASTSFYLPKIDTLRALLKLSMNTVLFTDGSSAQGPLPTACSGPSGAVVF